MTSSSSQQSESPTCAGCGGTLDADLVRARDEEGRPYCSGCVLDAIEIWNAVKEGRLP